MIRAVMLVAAAPSVLAYPDVGKYVTKEHELESKALQAELLSVNATMDAEVDAVLSGAASACTKQSNSLSWLNNQMRSPYTWSGLSGAITKYNNKYSTNKFMGYSSNKDNLKTLMALVSSIMVETDWFTTCKEKVSYKGTCSGSGCNPAGDFPYSYTSAKASNNGWGSTCGSRTYPIQCTTKDGHVASGVDEKKGCWFGRGAVQTTWPSNYGLLQTKLDAMSYGTNVCEYPDSICSDSKLAWLSAIIYWKNNDGSFKYWKTGKNPSYSATDDVIRPAGTTYKSTRADEYHTLMSYCLDSF